MTESRLRLIVGGILWTVAGSLTLSLFLTMAGDNWIKIILAVVWAVGLVAGEILTWRKGGGYRAIAVVIVIIQIFSAFGAAVTAGETDSGKSYDAQIAKIHESAAYKIANDNLIEARGLKKTLENRLAVLPPDFSTEAEKTRLAITGENQKITEIGGQIIGMEKIAGSGRRGMFEVIAGENAKTLEIIISLILATITEIAALALSGKAKLTETVRPRVVVTNKTPRPDPANGITADQYLAEVKTRHNSGLPIGRRVMCEILGISERQARYLINELQARGLVKARGGVENN